MADAPKLDLGKLRTIVSDTNELIKGTAFYDDGKLHHLARFAEKLYAEAEGSGASPYKVQIAFLDAGKVVGRCTCMAARSRPYCKHSAGLLVAWARAPESFAVSDTAPAPMPGEAKKKQVKRGKTDDAALMREGVERVSTLVRELSVTGLTSLSPERLEQIRALGASLREHKLRRLSARTLELAGQLAGYEEARDRFDLVEYAELITDLVLTSRKLEKHLAGEALEARYVEELIGKTWRKTDREAVSGLDLVEYAFLHRLTADDFVIRESRFLDLVSGEHYSEKQILPAFLAKRTEPKKSWAGLLLAGSSGSRYPGFSPHRLDLDAPGPAVSLDGKVLERVMERALPSVGAALGAYQERRRDVFAPERLPVALRVDTLLAEGARMQLVDAASDALFLPDDIALEEQLAGALRGAHLLAVLGEVATLGALPTLFPLAVVVEGGLGLELRPVRGPEVRETSKVKTGAATLHAARADWADTARLNGLSSAAIALGEVREELAGVMGLGLSALVPRFTEPLVARLRDLGLEKPAAALAAAAAIDEAAERLDSYVKVFQVLDIALTRITGAATVDRSGLVQVPTYESVRVREPEALLEPRTVASLVAAGRISRYQAAVHHARYYERIPPERLAEEIFPTWADGSASPYVARAFAPRGAQAIAAARRALGSAKGRVAWLTAVRVLEAVGSDDAERLLGEVEQRHADAILRRHAARARTALRARRSGRAEAHLKPDRERRAFEQAIGQLLSAQNRDDRIRALEALVDLADLDAIPYLRMSFAGDISREVREQAAYALARLGDTESVETFVRLLRNRQHDAEAAKIAAYALGYLGDVRGIDELLAAYAEAWLPGIVADAIAAIGVAALDPLLDLIEARPELAERKAALGVFEKMPEAEVAALISARVQALAIDDHFVARARTLLAAASAHASAQKAVARAIIERRPELREAKGREEKALLKKLQASV